MATTADQARMHMANDIILISKRAGILLQHPIMKCANGRILVTSSVRCISAFKRFICIGFGPINMGKEINKSILLD